MDYDFCLSMLALNPMLDEKKDWERRWRTKTSHWALEDFSPVLVSSVCYHKNTIDWVG